MISIFCKKKIKSVNLFGKNVLKCFFFGGGLCIVKRREKTTGLDSFYFYQALHIFFFVMLCRTQENRFAS